MSRNNIHKEIQVKKKTNMFRNLYGEVLVLIDSNVSFINFDEIFLGIIQQIRQSEISNRKFQNNEKESMLEPPI